jgi:hypothetical protein
MKQLACIVMLVSCALVARADDWLTNYDFSSGNDHWYGDAKWPTDFAPPDPFTKADPFTAQGMIIQLRTSDWIKECQDFKGKTADAVLTIVYALSTDFAFSQKAEDYQNMPDKIGWDAWKPFDSPPGSFVIFLSELEERHGNCFFVQPGLGNKDQTYRVRISGMTPWSQKTLALAFPPGAGMIDIKKVSLDDSDAAPTQ